MSYVNSYYDCTKEDDMMLEPRLMEYIKKKKFYKENGIEIEFLDKEYGISKSDSAKIKAYLKGDKLAQNDIYRDFIDPSEASFPSEGIKDARMERIKMKQKKEAEANEQRHDYGIISKSYDMYRNDRPFASATGDDFRKSSFSPEDWFKNSRDEMVDFDNEQKKMMDQKLKSSGRSGKSNRSFSQSNTYVNPRSSFNGYLSPNDVVKSDQHTIDSILGQLNSYTKRDEKIPYRQNDMDLDYKRMIPNNSNCNRRETENNYRPMPFMANGENGVRDNLTKDVDVDSFMRFGTTPLRGGKSLGYPSTAEHSFSYIASDIQDPNHVVMERGVPSRAFNKEMARP